MAAFPRPTALAVVIALLLSPCTSPSQRTRTPSATFAPDQPAYDVDLVGSGDARSWRGTEGIEFRNPGTVPLDAIWLRLWANGNDGCTPRAVRIDGVSGGFLAETRLACTAVRIDLDEPLAGGERARVELDLTIEVPVRNDRFGSFRGLTNMGGALPILAVRDDTGWHLDPYVAFGESFFSIVGNYRVRLRTPGALEIAATGVLTSETSHGATVTRTFVAQKVRDFVWTTGDLERATGEAEGVRIQVWYRAQVHASSLAERVVRQSATAMTAFADAFGAYPYAEVDVVLAGFEAFGGMEYPQLVLANPRRVIVSHELAHQWWWVTVGNDEYADPWLDESLATWSGQLPFRPWTRCDGFDWPSADARITNDMSYWGAHPKQYATIYAGGGCMLAELADHLGLDTLIGALARYQAAHRLGIGTATDLEAEIEATAEEAAPGFDVAAFWRQWRVDAPPVG